MAYKPELVAITPELKRKLDVLKHDANFSKKAELRAKRILAYGDLLQMMYDFYIANGKDKELLDEVPNDEQGTNTTDSY